MSRVSPTSDSHAIGVRVDVDAALASGAWRAKQDPKTGRTYYFNPTTRVRTWNLAKTLQKGATGDGNTHADPAGSPGWTPPSGSLPSSPNAASPSPSVRSPQPYKQTAAEEAQMAMVIRRLEKEKIELETEVRRLEGPVEEEERELAELQRKVADRQYAIDTVQREVLQAQRDKQAELEATQAQVRHLEAIAANDTAHRAAVREEHEQMTAEAGKLIADLESERQATERLNDAYREAERELAAAKLERELVDAEIARQEELVQLAEDDLEAAAKENAASQKAIEVLQSEKQELLQRAKSAAQTTSAALQQLRNRGGEQQQENTGGGVDELTARYHQRVATLDRLLRLEADTGNAKELSRGNEELRVLIRNAKRDAGALSKTATMVEAEAVRVGRVAERARADARRLAAILTGLRERQADREAEQQAISRGPAVL